jgi:uncharacterized NAD(P)/FAD-binding protein YdhS
MSVVVIGGGFSGAMTAAHLAAVGISTTLIEPGAIGRGLAYGTASPELLLNAPSAAMSALPEDPGHFVRWLAERGTTSSFAPRAMYGDYVAETATAIAKGLEIRRTRATSIERTQRGYAIACEDGRRTNCHAIVIALGNAPPRTPDAVEPTPHYVADPYAGLSCHVGRTDPIALLGTGLTAFDVIASLRSRGHRGSIIAVSRRGLVPRTFAPAGDPIEVPRELSRTPRLHSLTAWWRSRLVRGIDEATIVTALRPLLPLIWRRLPTRDREAFARHVRPRWEVIRHRAPPAVAAIVDESRRSGALEIAAGRMVATTVVGGRLRCTFLTPRRTMLTRDVCWLFNCTGPERDVSRQTSPLVGSLLASGMIEPDPLALGVHTELDGTLIGRDGPQVGAYAVGPWRVADLWESTAVPELRVQAADTAAAIARVSPRRATSRRA